MQILYMLLEIEMDRWNLGIQKERLCAKSFLWFVIPIW